MVKAGKALHAPTLVEIFRKEGTTPAALARSVAKAIGFARNDYEHRIIFLALQHYADEVDPPKGK